MLGMLRVSLHAFGFSYETALNGRVALEKIQRDPHYFRLIITDIRMPGLDGFELIEQSRATGYDGAFIVFCGVTSPDDLERLRELRVSAVIKKPARRGELSAAIRAAVLAS